MGKESKYGQFFTEKEMCDYVLEVVNKIKKIGGNCLEPSFGDGEFIKSLCKYNFEKLVGVEIDIDHYNKFRSDDRKIEVFNKDFIYFNNDLKYDLIVGNPPYIEVCYSFYNKYEQEKLKKEFKDISNGRMNLVHIFMKKSFDMLNEDGIIAYLLPSSILTSPTYKGIRKTIYENYNVEYLKEDVNFKNVAIKVCLLIIRKTKNSGKYYYLNNDNYFLMENYFKFKESRTLRDEKFNVSIGEVVWNQEKELLTDDPSEKMLIYSDNIDYDSLNNNAFRKGRKRFITNKEVRYQNCIIFPRTVSKKIKFYYIQNNTDKIFENHVLVLSHSDKSKLDSFYTKLKTGYYDELLHSFFNSSNLTKGELLSLPYNE
jgi:adenine-specific DNA-methyltransferase